jgi:hypothetical protein
MLNTQIDYSRISFDIIEVESLGIPSFNEMFKHYSITELNTAVKPFYFNYFLNTNSNIDNLIYLDPDILIYGAFSELEYILKNSEIVVIPHFSTPICDDKLPAENDILNSGLYNLGFLAIKRGIESQKFINWWASRLETKAYIDFSRGLFTDQIWINFVPLFYKNVHILQHPGYNMAYWNLHERILSQNRQVIFEGTLNPLIFFHFSGFNPLQPEILSKYQNRFSFEGREDICTLFSEYTNVLLNNKFIHFIQFPCYYELQKRKQDLELYNSIKKSIPIYRRIIRGIVLRVIKIFNVDIEYYTH